MVPFLVTLIDL